MSATKLKVWLPFDESATADKCGNEWTTYGTVSIGDTNAISGQALQLNKGYLRSNDAITFGGADFTVDFYGYMNSSSEQYAGFFCAQSTTGTGNNSRAGQLSLYRNGSTAQLKIETYNSSGGTQTTDANISSSSLTNERHHFELDYSHATSTLKIFVDGVLTLTHSINVERLARYIFLGTNSYTPSSQRMVGSIDEFQIYDGVALHTEKFTPPTAEDYAALAFILDGRIDFSVDVQRRIGNRFSFTADVQRRIVTNAVPFEFAADVVIRDILPVTFAADVQRKLSNQGTVTADVEVRVVNRSSSAGFWRYENPGSGDYIYYHDNITTEQVGYDKSVTGVAFYGGDRNDMVGVPTGCKELWLRFDLFLKSSITDGDLATSFSMGSTSNASGALSIAGYANSIWMLPGKSSWALCIGNTMYFTLTPGARNAILIYLKSGRTDGIVEGTVGAQTSRYIGNVNNGNDFDNVFFQSSKAAAMFSNVVISNAPLTLEDGWHREPVAVEMNIKAPDLCVRKNGTTYTVPFATTQDPPANSVVARLGGQMVYNPLVATDNANASVIKTRYNGNNRALSASFG